MNFSGQKGPFPGIFNPGTPTGRFRRQYQQSPPPNMGMQGKRDKVVTFMPNDIKIPKPPKQPEKPLPAYMRYSRKVWETVKAQYPDLKMWDIGKMIGEQWRNLAEDERQGFFAEYEVEKAEYQEAMKNYHNSTAYREWLKAKEKAHNAMQEQQMMEKMLGGSIPKEEPRFQLQQIEDDDEEAEFSVKHVAASRFQRNHRLIAEIFSETTVPDIKTFVTKPRLDNLKKQVQSLMQHQRKLESEIEEMEEKFLKKRRKILDKSRDFEEKMKELSEQELPRLPSATEIPTEDDVENKIEHSEQISAAEKSHREEKMEAEVSNSNSNATSHASPQQATINSEDALPIDTIEVNKERPNVTSAVNTELSNVTNKVHTELSKKDSEKNTVASEKPTTES